MSSEIAKAPLHRFIASAQPEVIALKGKWGVGKTYFWNRLVREQSVAHDIASKKYAYVSLFGVNSLDHLKSAIFEQSVSAESIDVGASIQSLKKNVTDFFTQWGTDSSPKTDGVRSQTNWFGWLIRRGASVAAILPSTQAYGALLRAASFMMVRDTLICMDDFERKGKALDAREILGLVSFLKEQRNCKIALIFNDGSLDPDTTQQYAQYREKVVDSEVSFSPSVKEAVEIVFQPDHPNYAQILDRATALSITNIRIFQKIARLLNALAPHLANRHSGTVHAVVTSIVLLSWAFFSRETNGPTLAYIKRLEATDMWDINEKKRIFEQQKNTEPPTPADQWNEQLKTYGWMYTDELDLLLAETVERGYPNDDALTSQLNAKDIEYTESNARGEIEQAWRMFHDSFDRNDEAFVSQLLEVARRNVKYLSRDALNGIVRILKELGKESAAVSIIDFFVETHKDRPKMFSLETFFPGMEPIDPYIQKRFFEMQGLTEVPQQMADVVRRVSGEDGWRSEDEAFLIQCNEDDYYKFLKAERSAYLHPYIRGLLRFGQFANATDQQKGIAQKTIKALQKIANESPLNALRVRRHNITPNDAANLSTDDNPKPPN